MSELANSSGNRAAIRWNLLASASALVLVSYISSADPVRANDADRPTLWIELGGQMEAVKGTSTPFTAPFMNTTPSPDFYNPNFFITDQRPPRHSFGLDGKITLQPTDSEWTFIVGARYGRSSSKKHVHYQTRGQKTRGLGYYTSSGAFVQLPTFPPGTYRGAEAFSDVAATTREQHLVLDFRVGRDVGIGLFGHNGSSNLSGGLRALEFSQNSTVTIYARPKVDIVNSKYPSPIYIPGGVFDQYSLVGHTERSFHGLGPSLAWSASADLMGNAQTGELNIDWGINVALLFGKQKAETDHSTTGTHYVSRRPAGELYAPRNGNSIRSRSVTVPNVGGFTALSVKYPNAKVSLGYRADFFFGAMDTGIDARDTKNLGFSGPFATISIGLGG